MDQGNDLSLLTMLEWGTLLKRVRQYMDYSQLETAELLNVGYTTYQKWEQGKRKPHPVHRRMIRNVFKDALCALGVVHNEAVQPVSESQEPMTLALTTVTPPLLPSSGSGEGIVIADLSPEEFNPLNTFISDNMTMHLLDLMHTEYQTNSERQLTIRQAIKDFDTMNTTNKSYQMTRREALSILATFPTVTLGMKPGVVVQPTPAQYGTILAHCSASLEACWQLYRSSDASAAQLAFQCVATYLPILTTIAKDSGPYAKEALHFASQYALLKTLLGWGRVGTIATIPYAQEAMSLSKATGDIWLQLSAYTKLGWSCSGVQKHRHTALETMQEGESFLQNYQHLKNMPSLPSYVVGNFYCTYALVQARNGRSPDTALGIATESDTGGDEHTAFMMFSQSQQWLEAANVCCAKGDPSQTMHWLGKRIDPETLAARSDVAQSERGRIETINVMTRALLQSKDRDMERIISVWTAGMQGAKALKDEMLYNEAMTNFEGMQIVWPGEKRITELRPLTEYW